MINNDLSSWFNSPYLSASQNVFDTKETANRNSAKMSEKHKKNLLMAEVSLMELVQQKKYKLLKQLCKHFVVP